MQQAMILAARSASTSVGQGSAALTTAAGGSGVVAGAVGGAVGGTFGALGIGMNVLFVTSVAMSLIGGAIVGLTTGGFLRPETRADIFVPLNISLFDFEVIASPSVVPSTVDFVLPAPSLVPSPTKSLSPTESGSPSTVTGDFPVALSSSPSGSSRPTELSGGIFSPTPSPSLSRSELSLEPILSSPSPVSASQSPIPSQTGLTVVPSTVQSGTVFPTEGPTTAQSGTAFPTAAPTAMQTGTAIPSTAQTGTEAPLLLSPEPTASPNGSSSPVPSGVIDSPVPTGQPTGIIVGVPSNGPSPILDGSTSPPSIIATPTPIPTTVVTDGPSPFTSSSPTLEPTLQPTPQETLFAPTAVPSFSQPSSSPIDPDAPSASPTISWMPAATMFPSGKPSTTTSPSVAPSFISSAAPSGRPTGLPTALPTDSPTTTPTVEPTNTPTDSPTTGPTSEPTNTPTDSPTTRPTSEPTNTPTDSPTTGPTFVPTSSPTDSPTTDPTFEPTRTPTDSPTTQPSGVGAVGRITGWRLVSLNTNTPLTDLLREGQVINLCDYDTDVTVQAITSDNPGENVGAIEFKLRNIFSQANPERVYDNEFPFVIGNLANYWAFTQINAIPFPSPRNNGGRGEEVIFRLWINKECPPPTDSPTTFPSPGPSILPTENPTALPSPGPVIVPSKSPTAFPAPGPTSQPTDKPIVQPPTLGPVGSISYWQLKSLDNGAVLTTLVDGQLIDLCTFPGRMTVEAVTKGTVGAMEFILLDSRSGDSARVYDNANPFVIGDLDNYWSYTEIYPTLFPSADNFDGAGEDVPLRLWISKCLPTAQPVNVPVAPPTGSPVEVVPVQPPVQSLTTPPAPAPTAPTNPGTVGSIDGWQLKSLETNAFYRTLFNGEIIDLCAFSEVVTIEAVTSGTVGAVEFQVRNGNGGGSRRVYDNARPFTIGDAYQDWEEVEINATPFPNSNNLGGRGEEDQIFLRFNFDCSPVEPPVEPPILPPFEPPVEPPVQPPIEPPVEPPIQPPVDPPVEPPVQPPLEPPVEPPIQPPLGPPVEPPIQLPVQPPVEPPIGPVGRIVGWQLISLDTNRVISSLTDGDTVFLCNDTRNLTVEAVTQGTVGTVVFFVRSGRGTNRLEDNATPFRIDQAYRDNRGDAWDFVRIHGTPFPSSENNGGRGVQRTLLLNFSQGCDSPPGY